jgi:proteasome activator subunit 4
MDSVTPAVSTLKKLAILEPDLIMPAIMERAVPSLQGLEEVNTLQTTLIIAHVSRPNVRQR